MRVNTDMLRGKIKERGFTQAGLAENVGMDESTFIRKMKNSGLTFSVGEMHKIAQTMSLTKSEATDIFLSDFSQ